MEILENPWPSPALAPVTGITLTPMVLNASNGEVRFAKQQDFRMYVCGITPYDATHLGHAATYLTFDLINRYQRLQGSEVHFVENITDVDEPLLERADRDQIDWRDLAQKETDLFVSDMVALRIFAPEFYVPVTQVMPLVDQAITAMQTHGYVYELEGDLYFRCTPFLGSLPISEADAIKIFAERGGDPARIGKEHPLDAILWVSSRNDAPGWESRHGFGRPGWHIECAVISLRFLTGPEFLLGDSSRGSLIDVQGGGNDLIFPHHFFSAAQVKAITGQQFAHAYVHTGMIGLNGEKMSKSKGNLVFVSKLLSEGVDPVVIRYALLQGRYSSARMWDQALLVQATREVEQIRAALGRNEVAPTHAVIQSIADAIAHDLDTPVAISLLLDWVKATESGAIGGSTGEIARALDSLMGLAF
jgi:L-cysteine:1D-myo-inositol 2-amino-2-deoxy-alpha-D-glucopyranoside ligase